MCPTGCATAIPSRSARPSRRAAASSSYSCADHVFPARDEPYEIAPGTTLAVGQPNVLNRIQAHVREAGAPEGRRDRLRRTLKELYGRCSAGTHADVSVEEARFVFLQTYVVLGEILSLGGAAA